MYLLTCIYCTSIIFIKPKFLHNYVQFFHKILPHKITTVYLSSYILLFASANKLQINYQKSGFILFIVLTFDMVNQCDDFLGKSPSVHRSLPVRPGVLQHGQEVQTLTTNVDQV